MGSNNLNYINLSEVFSHYNTIIHSYPLVGVHNTNQKVSLKRGCNLRQWCETTELMYFERNKQDPKSSKGLGCGTTRRTSLNAEVQQPVEQQMVEVPKRILMTARVKGKTLSREKGRDTNRRTSLNAEVQQPVEQQMVEVPRGFFNGNPIIERWCRNTSLAVAKIRSVLWKKKRVLNYGDIFETNPIKIKIRLFFLNKETVISRKIAEIRRLFWYSVNLFIILPRCV